MSFVLEENTKMNAFDEFQNIVKELNESTLRYALIGGVAMAFYNEPRFTQDIDILLLSDDISAFKSIIEKKGYFESAPPWTFKNVDITLHRYIKIKNSDTMIIDVLIPCSDIAKRVIDNAVLAESENGNVRIASKKDLIWLKSFRNSKQDQADIERLKND